MEVMREKHFGVPATPVAEVYENRELGSQQEESNMFTCDYDLFQQLSFQFFENEALESPGVSSRKPLGSQWSTRPANEHERRNWLLPTAPAATVQVKEHVDVEEVVDSCAKMVLGEMECKRYKCR